MDLLAVIGLLCVIYYLVYFIYPWFLDCDISLAFNEKFGQPISSLNGKVVWILGASSGIGEHLAYVLASAGCKLILSARRVSELERVKKQCLNGNTELQDSDIDVYAFDVCNMDIHDEAFKHVINKFGKLDILVNNAGRSQRANWEKIEIDVDKEMFESVFGLVALSRLVTKYFLEVGQGHIVVTSSLAGIEPVPFSASYCAAKHALHGYFEPLLIEKLGKNISITMACPGPIQTNFLAECFTEKKGVKYGVSTEISDTKLSAERCATLMAIAIANKLREVWISKSVPLQLTYLVKYFPNLGPIIISFFGAKFLLRVRDTKASLEQTK